MGVTWMLAMIGATPPGSEQPTRMTAVARLVRAELTKFRSVRAWMIAICAAGIGSVLVAYLSALASHAPIPAVPTGYGGEPVSDTYMLVHRSLAGDGTLTARVASLAAAHSAAASTSATAAGTSSRGRPGYPQQPGLAPWAKAGIIVEPDMRQGTPYAAVLVTGSHGVRMQYDYNRDIPGLAGAAGPSSPRWLRLSRAGDVIRCYDSADGHSWRKIGVARLAGLPRAVQIGLFVTSAASPAGGTETATTATARFDHIVARGAFSRGPWTADAVPGVGSGDVYPTVPADSWRQVAAGALTISGSGDIAPLVGDIISAQWAGASIVNGTIVALLVVIVLATVLATSEYRRGLIRATFAASPRRGRVLAAKAIAAGALGFATGTTATAISEVLTRHVLAASGSYLFPQSGPALARVVIGTGLLLGLTAALAVALGMMLRRGTAAVTAGIVLVVLPGILGSQSGNWLMRLTPAAAFAIQATLPRSSLVASAYTPPNGYFPVSPWAGLGVLAAYTALALCAAAWVLRHRDA